MANNKGFNLVFLILINISFITKEAAGSPISFSPSGSSSPYTENGNNPGVEFHVYVPKNEGSIGEAMEEELLNEAATIENEEEEDDCPNKSFFHIRGQRCVPLVCIGGNKYRDVATGECLIRKSFSNGNGMERSFGKYTPRTQILKASKGRLRFGLPTKLKG